MGQVKGYRVVEVELEVKVEVEAKEKVAVKLKVEVEVEVTVAVERHLGGEVDKLKIAEVRVAKKKCRSGCLLSIR
jgi:hypothetical protein